MMFYKQKLLKLKEKHRNEMKQLKYWYGIEKKFEKKKKKKIDMFDMNFKHRINASFMQDDEMKIQSIAKEYGYEIIDENITTTNSRYTFAML